MNNLNPPQFCSNFQFMAVCAALAACTVACSMPNTTLHFWMVLSGTLTMGQLFMNFSLCGLYRTGAVNQTRILQVILMGLTSHRRTQMAVFVTIFVTYLITMLGNLMVILLVLLDSRLHTPMYFFLSNLSVLEMCSASNVGPQMLAHLLSGSGRISFNGCMAQMYLAGAMVCTEGLLLGAMAYDRYVAICRPLIYVVVMSKGRCLMLASISWCCGFLLPVGYTHCILHLPFCGPNIINHFFCSLHKVSRLVCGEGHQLEAAVLVVSVVLLVPLCIILTTYGLIITSVMSMNSGAGRSKAFSTCASHLAVVTMFYGSLIALYLRPQSGTDSSHDKHVSVFYVVVTPLLNPVIYTLRNKDVQAAVAKLLPRGTVKCRG